MSRVWPLPFSIPRDVLDRAGAVKLAIFDVDGVLTDGSVTYGARGEEYKTFHVRDGQGIRSLMDCGIDAALVSARSSPALETRARELGIRDLASGETDKLRAFESLLAKHGLTGEQCCYVGDDLVDIPVMLQCGLAVAVADAHHAARHLARWVTPSNGGRGAVREVCDVILYAQQKFDDIMDGRMKFPATP